MSSWNYDPIIIKRRSGEEGDEYVHYTDDSYLVVNTKVILREIPSDFYRVRVTGLNETLSSNPSSGYFYCDYQNGVLYFNSDKNNTTILCDFFGIGIQYWPHGRVWVTQNDGEVTQTLEDFTDILNEAEALRVAAEIERETTTEEIKTAYDNATKANLSVEVTNARGTYPTLPDRLTGVDAQLAEKAKQTDLVTEITTRANAVSAEQTARLAEVDVERQRINSFTTLTAGSTTGDAELIDARVGADGNTYENAGGAIRGQFSNLNENITGLKGKVTSDTFKWVTQDLLSVIEWAAGFYDLSGTYNSSASYKNTGKLAVKKNDKLSFSANARYITMYTNGIAVSLSGLEYAQTFTVPSGIDEVIISFTAATELTLFNHTSFQTANSALEYVYSRNLLNLDALTEGKYVNKSGSIGTSVTYSYTDYIRVNDGDVICFGSGFYGFSGMKYVTAYDASLNVVSAQGAEEVDTYTVPSGVFFIIITLYNSRLTSTARICRSSTLYTYEDYSEDLLPKGTEDLRQFQYDITKRPLTILPPYFLNNMCYKAMGPLTQSYFCLVSDDGDIELANYTIPMIVSKGVPMTFAVMSSSEVFADSTAQATVLDAINNHGCSVAQHGGFIFTNYNEDQLNAYFGSEKDFFDGIGIEVKGAVCPAHNTNKTVAAVAGARFGVCRTGYAEGSPELNVYYGDYLSGARSNLYALSSRNLKDSTLNDHKANIDYAILHNLAMVCFVHENELTVDLKAQVEGVIDYAIAQGMTFVTLDQLAYVI